MVSLSVFITGTLHHPYYYTVMRQGMQVRLALNGLIYRKVCVLVKKIVIHKFDYFLYFQVLKLNSLNSNQNSSGKILNLISNDTSKIEIALMFPAYLVIAPLQAISIIILLIFMVDYTILAGLLILAIIFPLQITLGKLFNVFR